jgi:hypothetical protein
MNKTCKVHDDEVDYLQNPKTKLNAAEIRT